MTKSILQRIPVILSISEGHLSGIARMLENVSPNEDVEGFRKRLNHFSEIAGTYQFFPRELSQTTSCYNLRKLSPKKAKKIESGEHQGFNFEMLYPLNQLDFGSEYFGTILLHSEKEGEEIFAFFNQTSNPRKFLKYWDFEDVVGIESRKTQCLISGVETYRDGLNICLRQHNPNCFSQDSNKVLNRHGYHVSEKGKIVKKD